MQYLSITFVLFAPSLILIYYLVPAKARGAVLLLGSMIFYASFDPTYFIFLLTTAVSTYLAARLIGKVHWRKLLLAGTILVNAGIWVIVKEIPWLTGLLGSLWDQLGFTVDPGEWSWIVPVGISYYTLQAIGYLTDAYRGIIEPEKRFWKYLLFLSWFPAIVQGPISRYDRLMPQLLNEKPFQFEAMRSGLVLILFGLVKKLVIADRLAIFVDNIFSGYAELHGVILYLGAVSYAIQLYMDFSGCVDICRGVSGLFAVELPQNFDRPYLARSIREFWSKWHMSLSSWLKDYVYIPLGGNRTGTARQYRNLLITFLVSGLWHGAGFQFFLWGAIHGIYQILGRCTADLRGKAKQLMGVEPGSLSERIYQTVITFHLVMVAWIVFRADSVTMGLDYIYNMVSRLDLWMLFDGSLYQFGLSQNYLFFLIAHICMIFAVELWGKKQADVVAGLTHQHIFIRWAVYWVLIFDVLLFGMYGSGYDPSSFLYGGF